MGLRCGGGAGPREPARWALAALGAAVVLQVAAQVAMAEASAWGVVLAVVPAVVFLLLVKIALSRMPEPVKARRRREPKPAPSVSPAVSPPVSPAEPTGLRLIPDGDPLDWLRAHAGEPVAAQAEALGLSAATVKRMRAQLRAEAS